MSAAARRRWGQHFLVSEDVARAIVEWADVRGRAVLEIGPGRGALTDLLLERAASVRAVEIDARLADDLRRRGAPSLEVLVGDVLAFPVSSLVDPDTVVVANLPYESATAIVRKLLEAPHPPRDIVVMVQREVCQRLAAAPGDRQYGILSVHTALRADVEPGRIVRPGCFRPPPLVDSQVVRLRPLRSLRYDIGSPTLFAQLVGAAFGQRRKMLRNTLLPFVASRIGTTEALDLLATASVDPKTRPENVAVAQFAALSSMLHARVRDDGRDTL